ncbi:MAG: DUF362 domain-containing protein [Desulfonatronovibrionaceae bacterium]
MAASVYFWDLRASAKMPFNLRIKKLLKTAGAHKSLQEGPLVAVKIHFGEQGTTGFVSPLWVSPVLDYLRKSGSKPFLTDTNTLYMGQRGEAVSHALQAAAHGFDPNLLGAPVIIADGLKSNNERPVPCPGKHFEYAYIAGDILDADGIVNLSHFKGHALTGFGGALKNIGMGCATRRGKMQQHCGTGPKVKAEHCEACGVCLEVCAPGALSLDGDGIQLDREKCVGCASCIRVCPTGALQIDFSTELKGFMEKVAEYAAAALLPRENRVLHVNYVFNVSPGCDCPGFNDAPICPDLGVLASFDPVALDQCCLDLVNQALPVYPSALPKDIRPGEDKFKAANKDTDGEHLLEHARKLGLGTREYTLSRI